MTVASTSSKISYAGNGVSTVFPYNFIIWAASDLQVIMRDVSGNETTKALTTDYSVSGVGNSGGGNVTMVAAPAAGYTVVIKTNFAFTQGTSFPAFGQLPSSAIEMGLDRLTKFCQQLQEQISRSILAQVTSTTSGVTLPSAVTGQALGWNALGQLVNLASLAGVSVTTFMQTVLAAADASKARGLLGVLALGSRFRTPLWQPDAQNAAAALAADDPTNQLGWPVLIFPAASEAWARFCVDIPAGGVAHTLIIQHAMTNSSAVQCQLGVGYRVLPNTGTTWATFLPRWKTGTAYTASSRVMPSVPNGYYYSAGGSGTSGGSEPTWPTTAGNTVSDNGITWTCVAGGLKPLGVGATTVGATAYQPAELSYAIPSGDCVANGKLVVVFYRKSNDSNAGALWLVDAELQPVVS